MFKDIKNFHEKFDLHYSGKARELSRELQYFRIQFLEEELEEYKKAVDENNLHEMFDALIDLVYVALGTAYLHGFDFSEGWKRVHSANMSKVKALSKDDSKRKSSYDVVKPKGWKAPSLEDLL